MSCAKKRPPGAPEKLEAKAKKYLEEHGDWIPNDAEVEYQRDLIQRVHSAGGQIDFLRPAERQYYLLMELNTDLREASVFCFFDNHAGDHYAEVVELLHAVGLKVMAEGLVKAKTVLFGDAPVPGDVASRRRTMPTNRAGEPRREIRKALHAIDGETRGAEDDIEEVMKQIAKENALY